MTNADLPTVPSATADAAVVPGRIGRYQVVGALGSGGMGVVLLGVDTELERRVAIKLLHAPWSDRDQARDARARLEREARAMARVAHPNVVTVYEVGWADERLFLVMELVEGTTLRGWCATPRSWRAVVAMFVAAGRGLAAAHAEGLIHHDFKPDNVLIGGDLRPRVADFGLATGARDRVDAAPIAGTPAYMAPERWRGDEVSAASDQFALCVALWEALHGRRPFVAIDDDRLEQSICAGAIGPGDPRARHPRWLEAIVRRGLAVDPAARWPSVGAMLDAIERRARRRWWWPVIGGAIGATVATGLALILLGPGAAPAACPVPRAQLDQVWNDARSDAIAARVRALEPASAEPRLAAIARQRTRYLDAWQAMHAETCAATRIRAEQSDSLYDARMRCLRGRLVSFDGALALVTSAPDDEALDAAIRGLSSLPAIAGCSPGPAGDVDEDVLAAPRRAAVDLVMAEIDRVTIERNGGRLRGLLGRAQAIAARARRLSHPRTEASALEVLGDIQLDLAQFDDAVTTQRELIQAAARARATRLEAEAWQHLMFAVGYGRGQPAEALAMAPAATAAVLRAGEPAELKADLLLTEAQILDTTPAVDDAIARLIEARDLLTATPEVAAASAMRIADLYAELGNAYHAAERLTDAEAALVEARRRYRELAGPGSLDEARTLTNHGDTLRRAGRPADALVVLAQAEAIWRDRTGESVRLAEVWFEQASALGELGRWADAAPIFARALAVARARLDSDDPEIAVFLAGHASALEHAARIDEADAGYGEAIALLERDGTADLNLPINLTNRGELRRRRGELAAAIADHRAAIAAFEAQVGPTSSYLLTSLVGLGRAYLRQGQPQQAIAPLERALTLAPAGADALQAALAIAYLGRARGGTDGRAQAQAGRRAVTELARVRPDAADELVQFDAAARRPGPAVTGSRTATPRETTR